MIVQSTGQVFTYRPAEMTIHSQSAEMSIDWRRVWDSMGLESPLTHTRNRNDNIRQEAVESIAQTARDGDRVARSAQNKETRVFGNLANEKFQRDRKVETKLVLMPSTGPVIQFTTYRPVIDIVPNIPSLTQSGNNKVELKSAESQSSSYINVQL